MKRYLELTDNISFTYTITESTGDGSGRMVVEGRAGLADVVNANKRKYPRIVLEKAITRNPNILEAIKNRRLYGAIDHPKDPQVKLEDASHLITDIRLTEEGELLATFEVLNTPKGLILQELFRTSQPGASTRGAGTTKLINGISEVQDTYKFFTIDFVAGPSTPGAFPSVISEEEEVEIKENEEALMSMDKFSLLEQRASAIINARVPSDEAGRRVVSQAASALIAEMHALSKDHPELNALTESVVGDLVRVWNTTRKPAQAESTKPDDKKASSLTENTDVSEEMTGNADTIRIRTIPKVAEPPDGEGWAIDPADDGPLAGLADHVNSWMHENKDDDDDDDDDDYGKKSKCEASTDDEKDDDDEDDDMKSEAKDMDREFRKAVGLSESQVRSLARRVRDLREEGKLKTSHPVRVLADAFTVQRRQRLNERETYQGIIERMKEKFAEAVNSGKLVVEGAETDTVLKEKLDIATELIKKLSNQVKLQDLRLYAESKLRAAGYADMREARQAVAEAIKQVPDKATIDEAIVEFDKAYREAVIEENRKNSKKTLAEKASNTKTTPISESKLANLNEDTEEKETSEGISGAELGTYLAESLAVTRR